MMDMFTFLSAIFFAYIACLAVGVVIATWKLAVEWHAALKKQSDRSV